MENLSDILIGIVLVALTIFMLLASLVYLGDGIRVLRKEASPNVRAVVWILLGIAFLVSTFSVGHATGERFGWWDKPATDCDMTVIYDRNDKPIQTSTTCDAR